MGKRTSSKKRTALKKEIQLLVGLFVLLEICIALPDLPKTLTALVNPFGSRRISQRVLPYSDIRKELSTTPSASPTPPVSAQEYCLTVPVLMYHHIQPQYLADQYGQDGLTVNPEYFDMQMNYLAANGYHAIAAEDLVKALIRGTNLPDKPVIVTIDDGYQDIYDYAFPILKKYHITANLMIPTGLVGKHIATNTYLTWNELKEMKTTGSIFVYNHTVTHAALGVVSDKAIAREVRNAQQKLSAELGYTYPLLVYPYGSYSDASIRIEKALGIVSAFTTDPGEEECRSQLMKLPRERVGNAPLTEYGF